MGGGRGIVLNLKTRVERGNPDRSSQIWCPEWNREGGVSREAAGLEEGGGEKD